MNRLLARLNIDPFLLMLLGTVALATVLPAQGVWARVAGGVADAAIALLFFLHGAKLSREAILDGAKAWKLHLTVGATTFLLFPIIGLGVRAIPGIEPSLATGVLFLTLLPSTVQSSIAFTAIAGGNVAAAVVSASFSNLAGIFITPLLTALFITGRSQGFSTDPIIDISVQLLLPFLAGHFLRPWIGGFVTRNKKVLGYVDRSSILLVVYTAFGAAVLEGLWHKVTVGELALIAAISLGVLAVVMVVSSFVGKAMGFSREDRIVLLFCGSKKSLATGVPLAGVLFPAAQVGAIILPLMFFHQIQLMVCAVLARRFAAAEEKAASSSRT
ncbi:bile acid:sodium symporter family protein [Novosphingobium resinovorum]|jgi:sodium/bile acid cotransporter 7|uniref:Bile acid:sodium symporter n=1 Tax=Novosphingobium resinovorum TaxID=158500 RepID=A0A031JU47_9SPHN|nr:MULTISPECIES: bile acid:sodium symporter family protein [Sphingomonadaceae]EJU12473.1 bile acid:sodium symporter [Sphingomonas sp. LH128]EZP80308.1 Bile acid:sodium symporter [Novosphingobium resinovorum]MBF7012366.1 bile acid:sodium symporter [Novosphingobium sp. HR1a]WJM27107.1 bile acid:sodium symporter family protein [Novosphingobium resinovorum]